MIFQKRLFRESRCRYFTVFSMEEKMPYQKPVFYAQTAPQGSYAAGCPTNTGSMSNSIRGKSSGCPAEVKKCKSCQVTQ